LNKLVGYVRNRGDAGVEIIVEGNKLAIENFLSDLKEKKPSNAEITNTFVKYKQDRRRFTSFRIQESSETKELTGSIIPSDIGICNKCLRELRSPGNPRYNYFFITCTNCGPRYTAIHQLPYDRENTVMRNFSMCKQCTKEYSNPLNRRFHAQTTACANCGPEAYLTTSTGEVVPEQKPIVRAGRLLEEGFLLAIKGNGGFHVACSSTLDEPIAKLRTAKHRAQKPFALMSKNLKEVHTFANVSPTEASLLSSPAKPIVLLNKLENSNLSALVAPKLHNVGVMLPYTGLHVMLFDEIHEPAFVMTSANPSSEPIVIDNEKALKRLGSTVDYFLMHNRGISQRCDDSVVRVHAKRASFIRRSRGYAPAPIMLKNPVEKCTLGVGAEENVTACIILKKKAFISQYIGDLQNLKTHRFLEETISHLKTLTNAEIEAVACDMHPKFSTTRLAKRIALKIGCQVTYVQHHHAHMLSLMGEHGLKESIGIVCDGYGYGTDGKSWGGEILHCNDNHFQRRTSLEKQPMVGGDLATRYPHRMASGILGIDPQVEDWLLAHSKHFPRGKGEAQMIVNMLKSKHITSTTTSCGRILDAVSAILDLCGERTYQGEPAMKLESAAIGGHDILKLEPNIQADFLNTTCIVQAVFQARNKFSKRDLAYSTQSYLGKGLAQLAVNAAQETGVDVIGFSGGVAFNSHITSIGIKFLAHRNLPAGDGGISFGQALATVE
jgi:hydrogenase maturation protein HypF